MTTAFHSNYSCTFIIVEISGIRWLLVLSSYYVLERIKLILRNYENSIIQLIKYAETTSCRYVRMTQCYCPEQSNVSMHKICKFSLLIKMWFSKLEFICKVQINNSKSEYIKSHKLLASFTIISANFKFITLQNTILCSYVCPGLKPTCYTFWHKNQRPLFLF